MGEGQVADWERAAARLIGPALARSPSVAALELGAGALAATGALYRAHLDGPALLVADANTWEAAGAAAAGRLRAAGVEVAVRVLPAAPRPKPDRALAEALAEAAGAATPVAVGSGVVNDLVKYAAHRRGRPYFCVATAASMDGYASAGAPLVDRGFKITVPCRPPRAIVADLDVIRAAPPAMAGWGYGDLAGKVPAGGDWLVADALGIEPIDGVAWPMVQDNLAGWLAEPEAVARGEAGAVAGLFVGLVAVGFAMEAHGSSRPASGADHQIAHLWEMAGREHDGAPVAHGAAVAVGCVDALALYDWALGQDLATVDPDEVLARAPDLDAKRAAIDAAFPDRGVAERALAETAVKHLEPAAHRARLASIREAWPALRARLGRHLTRAGAMRARLRAAGAPATAADIGVAPAEHRATVAASRFLRSRYTVLDLIDECGRLDAALDAIIESDRRARPGTRTATTPARLANLE